VRRTRGRRVDERRSAELASRRKYRARVRAREAGMLVGAYGGATFDQRSHDWEALP
jgi:hypothetical protein